MPMSWPEDMNVLITFFTDIFFLYLLTYLFHDCSDIERQILSGGGHTFSELACFILYTEKNQIGHFLNSLFLIKS